MKIVFKFIFFKSCDLKLLFKQELKYIFVNFQVLNIEFKALSFFYSALVIQ